MMLCSASTLHLAVDAKIPVSAKQPQFKVARRPQFKAASGKQGAQEGHKRGTRGKPQEKKPRRDSNPRPSLSAVGC
eukprot:2683077-Prymnesium_polylepis.1